MSEPTVPEPIGQRSQPGTPAPRTRSARITATGPREAPRLLRRVWPVDPRYTHTLFIPTGRRTVRLNWSNPLALPLVAMVVVLSPLLLVWAAFMFVADTVHRLRHRTSAKERSQ